MEGLEAKKLIILGHNHVMYETLIDNFVASIGYKKNQEFTLHHFDPQKKFHVKYKNNIIYSIELFEQLTSFDKVDILLVDHSIDPSLISFFRVNILINLTANRLNNNEIFFSKPLILSNLLNILIKNFFEDNIFCLINCEWIYNESLARITSSIQSIQLTARENHLFKTLLRMQDFKAEKDYLLRTVWNYHQASESNTVETHLYKLKQKLPVNLLEIKNSHCLLNIETIK